MGARQFSSRQTLQDELESAAVQPRNASKRIFWLLGGVGLGKSTSLWTLKEFCDQRGIPAALLHVSSADTEISISEGFARELEKQNVSLERLTKLLRNQEAVHREVRERRQQAIDLVQGQGRATSEDKAAFTHYLMTSGPDSVLRASVTDQPDSRITLLRDLASELVADLKDVSADRPVVLMLDDIDCLRLRPEWPCEWIGNLPDNTVFVFATASEHLDWQARLPQFSDRVARRPVEALSDAEIRDFAGACFEESFHLAATKEQLDAIVEAAEGCPFWVPVLAEHWQGMRTPHSAPVGHPGGNLVDQLLGDSRLRQALQAVSVPREFDEDLALKMIDAPDAANLWRQIRLSQYVTRRDGTWKVRSLIRDQLNDNPRRSEHRKLHQRALDYYDGLIADRERDGGAFDDDRQAWELERLYHQYNLSPGEGEELFRSVFEHSYYLECEYPFCLQLINEARSLGGGSWVDYYQAVLLHERDARVDAARDQLEEILKRVHIASAVRIRALKYLATLLWFFDPKSATDADRAKNLYGQSLALARKEEDKREEMVNLVWLDNLSQRCRGNGIPYYEGALTICMELAPKCPELQAWLEKELGDALRLKGRFLEARRKLTNSVELWGVADRKVDRGHAQRTLAMLYVFMGNVDDAEELFREARRAFEEAHFLRRWEDLWTTLGLGDVALGRGEYDVAQARYQDALRKAVGDPFGEAVVEGQLAEVCCRLGQWDQAIDLAKRSIQKRALSGGAFGIGWACCALGMALAGKKDYQNAFRELDCGRRSMTNYESAFVQSRLALEICRVHWLQGNVHEFRETAGQVKNHSTGETGPYYDHLAQVEFLEASVLLQETKNADRKQFPLLAKETGHRFCLALAAAVQYNVYLADSLLESMKSAVAESGLSGQRQKAIADAVRLAWDEQMEPTTDLDARESEQRNLTRLGGRNDASVASQLQEWDDDLGQRCRKRRRKP
jgi:tetratricopeptide (TPR) repeat protein